MALLPEVERYRLTIQGLAEGASSGASAMSPEQHRMVSRREKIVASRVFDKLPPELVAAILRPLLVLRNEAPSHEGIASNHLPHRTTTHHRDSPECESERSGMFYLNELSGSRMRKSELQPSLLLVCRRWHEIGRKILAKENALFALNVDDSHWWIKHLESLRRTGTFVARIFCPLFTQPTVEPTVEPLMTLYIDAEQSLEQSSDLDRIWLIFSKDDLPIVVRFLASWTTLPPWLGSAPKHAIQAVRVHLHANSLIYGYPRRLQWSIDHWRDYIFPLLHGSIVSTKLDYFSPFERPYQFTRQIRNTMRADFAVESNGPANIDWRERIYSIENRIKCCQKKSVRAMRVARAAGDSMSLAPLAHIIFSFLHDLHAFTLHEKSWPTDRHYENFEILVQRTLQYIKLLYELSDAHQTSPRRRREARRFCNHAANDIRFCLGVLCAQQRFPFTFSNLGNFNRQQIADVGGQILWRDYYHRLETIFGILLDDIDEVLDDISTPSLYLTVNLMHRALCYAQASSTKRAERYLSAAIRLCAPAEADAVEWTALEMAKIYAVWWELAPAMRAKLKLPTEPSDWPEDSEWSWTWNKDSRQDLLEYAKVVWADLVRQRYGSEEVVVLKEWREL